MLLDDRHVALTALCAKEVTRYAINNLCVEAGGAVASDGRCLGYVPVDGIMEEDFPAAPGEALKDGETVLLHPDELKRAAAARPKGRWTLPVMGTIRVGVEKIPAIAASEGEPAEREEGRKAALSVVTGSGVMSIPTEEVEATFPAWRSLVPSDVARGCEERLELACAMRGARVAAREAGEAVMASVGRGMLACLRHGRTAPRRLILNPHFVEAVARVAGVCEDHRIGKSRSAPCMTVTVRSKREAMEIRTGDGSIFLVMPLIQSS